MLTEDNTAERYALHPPSPGDLRIHVREQTLEFSQHTPPVQHACTWAAEPVGASDAQTPIHQIVDSHYSNDAFLGTHRVAVTQSTLLSAAGDVARICSAGVL